MSGGRVGPGPAPALLGVEIGRNHVCLALLDPDGKVVDDAVGAPIVGGDVDEATAEVSISGAIMDAVSRLGVIPGTPLRVGATIGFPHCGVGSGPTLGDWLFDLSRDLGEPVVHVGDHGVSYAPIRCLDFIDRVFRSASLRLDRVELAPVAASRTLGLVRSGSVTLGSGVAWSARILDGEMMEAYEALDGAVDEVLHLVTNGSPRPVGHLDGVFLDDGLCRARGVSPASLAPAVGVALGLHDPPGRNLLDGRILDAAAAARPHAARPHAALSSSAQPRRPPERPQLQRTAARQPASRLSATDLLIGALLMLMIVLIVTLVVP